MKNKISFKLGNKEFSLSFVLSVLSSAIGVAFSFLAARFLQSELYGEIQYYISIISVLSMLMVFGCDNFLVKNLQFAKKEDNLLSKMHVFVFLLSTLMLPIYFRIGFSLLQRLNQNVSLILTLFFISFLVSLTTLGCSFFQAKNKYEIKVLFSSFIPHLLFLITFLLHFLTHSLYFFVHYYLVYYAIFYGAFGVFIFIKLFKFGNLILDKNSLITILFFGLSWVFYNVTSPLTNIIVGEKYRLFGLVGIFSISSQIMTISAIPTSVLSEVSHTVFAKLTKEKRFDDLFEYYKTYCRLSIYMSVPFYAAFIIGASNIFKIFGDSYLGHNLVLILMACSAIVDKVTGPCGSILMMGGKEKENLIASIVRFSVFIGVTFGFINLTVYAALIGLLASSIISNGLKLIFLRRFAKRSYFSFNVLLTFLVVASVCAICFGPLMLITNLYVWLGLNAVVGIILLILPIIISPFKADRNFFKKGKENI